jgi:hypothetical protein
MYSKAHNVPFRQEVSKEVLEKIRDKFTKE